MADDKTEKKLRVEDTVWVICESPVTLLMPTTERRLQPGGKETAGLEPLKLERGVNVLGGLVPTGMGESKFLTLEGLPAKLQQQPPAERAAAVAKIFATAKERYAQMFTKTGSLPAVIGAVGTIAELVAKHIDLLMTAARLGTHRASVEALSVHPHVPDHIRELARTRLHAWSPAA